MTLIRAAGQWSKSLCPPRTTSCALLSYSRLFTVTRVPSGAPRTTNDDPLRGRDDLGTTQCSLYVHWPYCSRICPYCDFNRYVRSEVDHDRMAAALSREISHFVEMAGVKMVTSVFFGGGTPSLARPSTFGAVLECIADRMGPNTEVTMEANPTSLEANALVDFKAAGVNRISVGVQSMHDHDLELLGRAHTAKEAMMAINTVRRHFDKYSFDLIYGRPHQEVEAWAIELEHALKDLGGGHVSLYQLTIEEKTKYARMQRAGKLRLPTDMEVAAMYEHAVQITREYGYHQYEASNFAMPGHECEHNMNYWRGGAYIGSGPGAHGRLGEGGARWCIEQARDPGQWLSLVESPRGHGTVAAEELGTVEHLEELIILSMRTSAGLTAAAVARARGIVAGPPPILEETFAMDRLDALVAHGLLLLEREDSNTSGTAALRPTVAGLAVANSLVEYIVDSIRPEIMAR